MKKIKRTAHVALNLPSLRLEGHLFLPDQLEQAAFGRAEGQSEADYHTPKGLKLKDDYSRAFQIASAQWKHFAAQLERCDIDAHDITITFVLELLRDALGYHNLQAVSGINVGERLYPVSLLTSNVPVIVAPHDLALDAPDERFAIVGSGSRKKSAFQLAQEFLNASPDYLWAMVSNGKQLRLLRDADTLTRPSFLEVDLQDLLSGQRFAEFAMAWRLLHASRAGQPGNDLGDCIWEAWRSAGQEQGTRVREGLREGVTRALLTLGSGFLQHSANEILRRDLQEGRLSQEEYFQQLLRLIYRLIFLFTVEERGLLHPADDSAEAQRARRAYAAGYALARLREPCLRRRARTRFDDLWQGARIVFRGLNAGEPRLALPALGGLFASSQCPALDAASLTNANLLPAIQHLRWAAIGGTLVPVDYRNMGPEELGSVYESLLELVPEVDVPARQFGFVGMDSEGNILEAARGNDRKKSGSYYTPDSLVQELIKSALEPVIEQRLADHPDNPADALLNIKVIDPACGSGHFLLATARRLAEHLAALRSPEGAVKPQDYRHALREVISRCIFGVDRNPMALELCRTALWLEGFEEGRPLSFLDHHLQCGDSLLGVTDLKALEAGIPAAAFKPLSGDDKDICKQLAKANKLGLAQLERDLKRGQQLMQFDAAGGLAELQALEALPNETQADITARANAWERFRHEAQSSRLAHAADLLLGAFVLPKTEGTITSIPTSQTLYLELFSDNHNAQHQQQLTAARKACREACILHWPLAFPQVFQQGGFDCVLGNPPWERIKLQEEEFFATRSRLVAEAKNKAERSQRINWLAQGQLAKHLYPQQEHSSEACIAEQRLYQEFLSARRTAEAASVFAHVKNEEGGRYPLTGVGDVNTYALFAETISQITDHQGRAGFIVPTGIATDDSTKSFFGSVIQNRNIVSLVSFYEVRRWFPATDERKPFCLLTLGVAEKPRFIFDIKKIEDIAQSEKWYELTAKDFERLNPNTLTLPTFRAKRDASLAKKIYTQASTFIREARGEQPEQNPWEVRFMTMFHMSGDSHLFQPSPDKAGTNLLPLYEAKMIHQFDHRWASYRVEDGKDVPEDVQLTDKQNPNYRVTPRYWVAEEEVRQHLQDKGWDRQWLLGFRDITNAAAERTLIACVVPISAVGHTMPLMLNANKPELTAALLANLSSLTLDFIARVKVGGTHLTYGYLKQFPLLPPDAYSETDLAFIVPRVLELTYTAWDMQPWAQDLGFDGEPFAFNPERRAILRAELDAWYASAYGLSSDEQRYILDPADIEGPDYPSETFRVLQKNELKQFGEYRTQRLVLREFDRMALAKANNEAYLSLLNPPPGQQAQPIWSSQGIIRDEGDARLAGLVLAIIQQTQNLHRRDLTKAITMLNKPELLEAFISAQDAGAITVYRQRHATMFTVDRLADGRLQIWLRHFESMGLIQVKSQGDRLSAVFIAVIPNDVIFDDEAMLVAEILLKAVNHTSAGFAGDDIESTDESAKRA